MCLYCRAASAVLDELWDDDSFRDFFYELGYELADLGPLTHDVFVPAYLSVKGLLRSGELDMLEAQVTEDLLGPLYDRPSFREMWDAWDRDTREEFLREQSEMQVAHLLMMVYDMQMDEAYRQAFVAYLDGR